MELLHVVSIDFEGLITKVTIARAFQLWDKLSLKPCLPQDGNHIKILIQLEFFIFQLSLLCSWFWGSSYQSSISYDIRTFIYVGNLILFATR